MKRLPDNDIPVKVLKQTPLEKHLPKDSVLRRYLESKDETGLHACGPAAPNLVKVRDGFNRQPKVLLVMPPMCMYEGAVKRVIPPLRLSYIAAGE